MFIYFWAPFIEHGSNRWVFYQHWSKRQESSFTNRFYDAFGIDLKFLNCSPTKFKWKRAGLFESWGARKVSWQYCHASAQNKIRLSSLLLKGKSRKRSYTQLFLRHTHRKKDSVMILPGFLLAYRKGHPLLSCLLWSNICLLDKGKGFRRCCRKSIPFC